MVAQIEVACQTSTVGQHTHRRSLGGAHGAGMVAARVEAAARGEASDPRRLAGKRMQGRLWRVRANVGGTQQAQGVRVPRRVQHLCGRAGFHQPTCVQHQHVVRDFGHHVHVVCDEQHRNAFGGDDVGQQVEDLRLDGHVQRRRRLIGDDQRRTTGQGHRDHDALAHAPRNFKGIQARDALRIGQSHTAQQCCGAAVRLPAVGQAVRAQGFGDLFAHGPNGVQGAQGVLVNHRQFPPAHAPHGVRIQPQQIAPM